MRILGIDYGDRRIGVAVSDAMGWTAQGVGTIINKGEKYITEEIEKIIAEYNPQKIVIGLPKNMDGTTGFRAEETYKFAEIIKKIYRGDIIYQDERLTTVGATAFLNETNTYGAARKKVIDTVSACLILETYLNSLNNK